MKKVYLIGFVLVILSALVLSGCAAKPTGSPELTVPADYAGKKNPFDGQSDAAEAGKVTFTDHCSTCHGESGKGDGPGGASLKIKPADLTEVAANDGDDRILWTISEGGAAAGKSVDMPAWKASFSEEEIWQVITYLRTIKQ